MEQKNIRYLIYCLWAIFLACPVLIFIQGNGGPGEALSALVGPSAVYLLLRLSGLYAFFLVFSQIILGSAMPFWSKIFGPRAPLIHENVGIATFVFILLHPTFFFLSGFLTGGLEGLLMAILPSFKTSFDFYVSFGRLALSLFILTVAAAYLRHLPFLNRHWRKLHIVNYVAYLLVALHSLNVGSDTGVGLFKVLYFLMNTAVVVSIGYRLFPQFARLLRRQKALQ